jgi:hypothetical protein
VNIFYTKEEYQKFWDEVRDAQNAYIFGFPIFRLMDLLSIWYTTALVLEYLGAFTRPEKLAKWSGTDTKIKIIITLLNSSILLHIVLFFKFTTQGYCVKQYRTNPETKVEEYVGSFEADMICLSDTYRESTYIIFEKYVYFFVFKTLPWLMSLVALVQCYLFYKEECERVNIGAYMAQTDKFFQTASRSPSAIFAVGITFLTCHFFYQLGYCTGMPAMQIGPLDMYCQLIPSDAMLNTLHQALSFMLFITPVINAMIKPWLILGLHEGLKGLLQSFFRKSGKCLVFLGRKCCLCMDCTRPVPPEEDFTMTASNMDLVTAEEPGSAAPYYNKEMLTHAHENPAVNEREIQESPETPRPETSSPQQSKTPESKSQIPAVVEKLNSSTLATLAYPKEDSSGEEIPTPTLAAFATKSNGPPEFLYY